MRGRGGGWGCVCARVALIFIQLFWGGSILVVTGFTDDEEAIHLENGRGWPTPPSRGQCPGPESFFTGGRDE